jgi:hypothetical protein
MGKLRWPLLILYLIAAAGYGGWRGPDFWSGWGLWCFLLPPVAWTALTSLEWWRSGGPIRVAVLMSVVAVVGIGASALGIAWGVAEATARWSAEPAVRAVLGVGLGAAGGGLTLLAARSRASGRTDEPERRVQSGADEGGES